VQNQVFAPRSAANDINVSRGAEIRCIKARFPAFATVCFDECPLRADSTLTRTALYAGYPTCSRRSAENRFPCGRVLD
jgi:hypothetical protein